MKGVFALVLVFVGVDDVQFFWRCDGWRKIWFREIQSVSKLSISFVKFAGPECVVAQQLNIQLN